MEQQRITEFKVDMGAADRVAIALRRAGYWAWVSQETHETILHTTASGLAINMVDRLANPQRINR